MAGPYVAWLISLSEPHIALQLGGTGTLNGPGVLVLNDIWLWGICEILGRGKPKCSEKQSPH